MPQLPLFESRESVLVDDERGRITYTPGLVEPATERAWFLALREGVKWKAERRRMYDRDVDVPRLTGHYRLDGGPSAAVPPAIVESAARVHAATGVPFNSVGLNFYRDGRDSVAPHNDHLDEIREGFPIALLSLGSPRRMTIRAKAGHPVRRSESAAPLESGGIRPPQPPRRVLHVDLEPGSLLVMSYATQLHYTHGIPKTKEAVGQRISLAFRVKHSPGEGSGRGFYDAEG